MKDSSLFTRNQQILLYQKYKYRLHFDAKLSIILMLFEILKIVLINMVTILMMPAKIATLDLLEVKLFWNKDCDATISVDDGTNKILSRDSNYIADVVMWPSFIVLNTVTRSE